MLNYQKCAVIGCGNVGATTAYTLATGGLFSDLILIDVNHKKAEGEAMDINHGISFTRPCRVVAGDYSDLKECALIIIAAGASQNPGETRIDLLNRNAAILKKIIPSVTAVNSECILLIVSNPVDILTYMSLKISGFPTERVIGSGTVLDTSRLKFLLGQQLGVDGRNVHAFIIGEHGDSELAVWSSANVSGIDLSDYCKISGKYSGESLQKTYEGVRDSAYTIIENKGATYYAIAMAVQRIAECIVRDENSVLPVSSFVKGHYGLNEVCMGLPTVLGKNGVKTILDIPLSKDEESLLHSSADKLKDVLSQINL